MSDIPTDERERALWYLRTNAEYRRKRIREEQEHLAGIEARIQAVEDGAPLYGGLMSDS